jgi:ABC-type glycerol-3-phosphate transport system substrate-binding protein
MRSGKRIGVVIAIITVLLVSLIIALKSFPAHGVSLKVLYPQSLTKYVQPLLDDYSEHIQNVDIQEIPYDGLFSEQILQDADLVLLENPVKLEVADWTKTFQPLDEFFSAKVDSTVLLQQEASPRYMIPLCGEVPVAIYNKEVFARVGIACPENINDFFKACNALQLEEIVPVVVRLDDVTMGSAGTSR